MRLFPAKSLRNKYIRGHDGGKSEDSARVRGQECPRHTGRSLRNKYFSGRDGGESKRTVDAPMPGLCSHHPLPAIGFRACIGDVVALAVKADDEHGASVAFADGLVGSEDRSISALRRDVPDALAEAAMAELVGAMKELNGIVGVVGS